MNILTRDFTKKEKILLLILGIVILASVYYLVVYSRVEDGIRSANDKVQDLETQLIVTQAQIDRINSMSDELASLKQAGFQVGYMPSYNAGKQELDFLHATLADTVDYFVNFTDLTREGDQIRREFSLQFTAKNYKQAENIIKQLENSDVRCLVGNVYAVPAEKDDTLLDKTVSVSLTGTFYETMRDGVPDQELPEDENAAETDY